MAEFTYFGSLIQNHEAEKFLAALVVGGALVAITRSASTKLSTPEGVTQAIIPSKSLNLSSFFDLFVEFFVRFQDSILGKERRQYLPFTGTIFLFLLTSNLLGLIPGMPALTTTVWVNVGFAFVVFFYFHIQGIKTHGLGGYLKHFFGPFTSGPMVLIGLFLFCLEFFLSLPLRILTLNLRLYWNITADHTVLELFTSLVPYGLPIVFYILGTFVCFMQAFIFTTLTMVYILLATQHEEGHEHH